MNRYVKTLGIAAALAAMIPLSAYAASAVPGKSGTAAGSAVVQSDSTDAEQNFLKARGGKWAGGHGVGASYVNEDVLTLLNLDREALQEKLEASSTLEEIAASQGVAKDQLKAALTAAFEKRQSEMKQQFEANLDTLISTKQEFKALRSGGRINMEAVAEALGMTGDELQTALQADGATISSVAKDKGISTDTVIGKVTEAITAQINQAVADGKLSADQAAVAKEKAQEQAERIVNGEGFGPKGMDGGRVGFHGGKGDRKAGSAATGSSETSA